MVRDRDGACRSGRVAGRVVAIQDTLKLEDEADDQHSDMRRKGTNNRTSRTAIVTGLCACMAACGGGPTADSSSHRTTAAVGHAPVAPTPEEQLQRLLSRFEATDRRGKGAVVNQIREGIDAFEPLLLELISGEDPEFLVAGIRVAGWLRLKSADGLLRWFALNSDAEVRAASVHAGAHLWQEHDYDEYLSDGDEDVIIAALDANRRHRGASIHAILRLLDHDSRRVQRAVVATFPTQLDDQSWDVVYDRIERTPHAARPRLVEVLEISRDDRQVQRCLLRMLHDSAWNVRVGILGCLEARGDPIEDTDAIWRLVAAADATDAERVAAWRVLTAVGKPDASRAIALMPSLDPAQLEHTTEYVASVADRDALRQLVHLHDTHADSADSKLARIATEANRALSSIAGTDHATQPGGWAAWLTSLPPEMSAAPAPDSH